MTLEQRTKYNRHRVSSKPLNLDNQIWCDGKERIGANMSAATPLIDYIRFWLENVKKLQVKPATFDRLLTSAFALEEYHIAQIPMGAITPEDCEDYVKQITARGYALTTIKKQMLIVSAPISYAYEHKKIPFNPAACMKPPSKSNVQKAKKKIIAYDKREQAKLYRVTETRKREAYAAIEIMIETGIRPGEALALNWDDIDLEARKMFIHATVVNLANRKQSYVQEGAKSETSNRPVPLSPRAINLLRELAKTKQHDYVFVNSDGTRLSYESLRYQCQKACEEAGIAYHGLHVFRHTFATNQFYKGTNVKILSKILGHSETSVTYNTYIHLYDDGFDEMLNAVS